MAQLCYTNIRKHRYRDEDEYCQILEIAQKEKADIIKGIVSKQLNSTLKLEECIENRNKFATSSTQEDSLNYSKGGLSSCSDFKNVTCINRVINTLAASNLSQYEIDLLLHDFSNQNEHPDVYLQQLNAIKEKLSTRQKFLNENGFAQISSDTSNTVPPDHPINHLLELEAALFPPSLKKDNDILSPTKKKRKCLSKIISHDALYNVAKEKDLELPLSVKSSEETSKRKSFWDLKEIPLDKFVKLNSENSRFENKLPALENDNKLCESSKGSTGIGKWQINMERQKVPTTNFAMPFVWTLDKSQLTPLAVIKQNKIDISLINKDEKLKCNVGTPSCTLYIKNLPRDLPPENLVSVFSNFETIDGPKIVYRILKGKMKGQAFIKFPNLDSSKLALATCNGFIINGKPMVIEFGKSGT